MEDTHQDRQKVFLPDVISHGIGDKKLFLLDADHRGDMYHVRVARSLEPDSVLLIYNLNYNEDKHEKLRDYCKRISIGDNNGDVILTGVKAMNKKPPGNKMPVTYEWNGKKTVVQDVQQIKLFSHRCVKESRATKIIENHLNSGRPGIIEKVRDATALLREDQTNYLDKAFAQDNYFLKKHVKADQHAPPRVLILDRDSGANGGAYPELDTGAALGDIVKMITDIGLDAIVLGGSTTSASGGAINIKEYWKDRVFDDVASAAIMHDVPGRDIEAYFLRWAYDHNYYHMVVGSRSGLLDQFTFLNIPTVSIGLRYFAGEERHERLAKQILKRVNVQYNVPRHQHTALDKPNGREPTNPLMWNSPLNSRREKIEGETMKPPEPFGPLDKEVVKLAISYALQKNRIVNSSNLRSIQLPEVGPQVFKTSTPGVMEAINNGPGLARNDYEKLREILAEDMERIRDDFAAGYSDLAPDGPGSTNDRDVRAGHGHESSPPGHHRNLGGQARGLSDKDTRPARRYRCCCGLCRIFKCWRRETR